MLKKIFTLSLAVVVVAAAAAGREARAANPSSYVATWQQAWNGISDYTCDINSWERKGSQTESRQYHFFFKKPVLIRLNVTSGTRFGDPGSVAVYTGTGKVVGHQGPPLAGINLALPLTDPKTTGLRGGQITNLVFSHELALIRKFEIVRGRIEVGAETVVNGHATTPITLFTNNPTFITNNEGIARDVIYYDNAMNLPLRWEGFDRNGTKVLNMDFTNLRTNVGLQRQIFNPKVKV